MCAVLKARPAVPNLGYAYPWGWGGPVGGHKNNIVKAENTKIVVKIKTWKQSFSLQRLMSHSPLVI